MESRAFGGPVIFTGPLGIPIRWEKSWAACYGHVDAHLISWNWFQLKASLTVILVHFPSHLQDLCLPHQATSSHSKISASIFTYLAWWQIIKLTHAEGIGQCDRNPRIVRDSEAFSLCLKTTQNAVCTVHICTYMHIYTLHNDTCICIRVYPKGSMENHCIWLGRHSAKVFLPNSRKSLHGMAPNKFRRETLPAHLGDTKGICDCTSVCDSACSRAQWTLSWHLTQFYAHRRRERDDFGFRMISVLRCLIGPKKSIDSELDVLFVPGRRADGVLHWVQKILASISQWSENTNIYDTHAHKHMLNIEFLESSKSNTSISWIFVSMIFRLKSLPTCTLNTTCEGRLIPKLRWSFATWRNRVDLRQWFNNCAFAAEGKCIVCHVLRCSCCLLWSQVVNKPRCTNNKLLGSAIT